MSRSDRSTASIPATGDRARAALAITQVRTFGKDHRNLRGKYKSRVVDLGLMIRQNGLINALVFVRSREAEVGAALSDQIRARLADSKLLGDKDADLLAHLAGIDEADFLRLQNEAMLHVGWLKRLAVVEFQDVQADRD